MSIDYYEIHLNQALEEERIDREGAERDRKYREKALNKAAKKIVNTSHYNKAKAKRQFKSYTNSSGMDSSTLFVLVATMGGSL